jgi:hypothetical protein
VAWAHQLSDEEAERYTMENILGNWLTNNNGSR